MIGTLEKNEKPADEIVFTNHRSSGSHRPDPDPDDDKPSLNTEDHYGYIIGYPVDYYTGLPTEDQTKAGEAPGQHHPREVATIYFRMLTDESRNHFWSQDTATRMWRWRTGSTTPSPPCPTAGSSAAIPTGPLTPTGILPGPSSR